MGSSPVPRARFATSAVCRRVDELFDLLKRKRELWKSFNPNKAFPGVCILQVDENVPAIVVKSVFQTAAYAGYPNISFMVRKRGKPGGRQVVA